jgi:hypothetical protein
MMNNLLRWKVKQVNLQQQPLHIIGEYYLYLTSFLMMGLGYQFVRVVEG